MKVLVFGGTTEGRLLARELSALGAQVTVSVATALGAEELRGVPPLTVCVGRKDTRQMREMLPGFAVCVDATHPYAAEASGKHPRGRALRPGCRTGGCCAGPAPCRRTALLCPTRGRRAVAGRHAGQYPAGDGREGACRLCGAGRGSGCTRGCCPRTRGLRPARRRACPTAISLRCRGLLRRELNEALMRRFDIGYLVTKDGGAPGGFGEKAQAARNVGARLVVIRRPADSGEAYAAVLNECREMMACR